MSVDSGDNGGTLYGILILAIAVLAIGAVVLVAAPTGAQSAPDFALETANPAADATTEHEIDWFEAGESGELHAITITYDGDWTLEDTPDGFNIDGEWHQVDGHIEDTTVVMSLTDPASVDETSTIEFFESIPVTNPGDAGDYEVTLELLDEDGESFATDTHEEAVLESAHLSGTVENATSNEPLEGATVRLTNNTHDLTVSFETDESGEYSGYLPALTYESYHANKEGYLPYGIDPTPFSPDEMVKQDFELDTAAQLSVTATDPDGNPIPYGLVMAEQVDGDYDESEHTDQDGTVVLDLPEGEFNITLQHDNFETDAKTEISVTTGDVTEIELEAEPTYETGHVNGTVLDPDGNEVSDATVTVSNDSHLGEFDDVTDGSGEFSIEAPVGEATVSVEADGYMIDDLDLTVPDEDRVITLEPAGTIQGTVTDAEGNTLEDVDVTILDFDTDYHQHTTTNEDGEFELVVPPGEYDSLEFAKDGFARTVEEDLSIDQGDEEQIDKTLQEAAIIEGYVFDEDGEPVEGVQIDAHAHDENVFLDAETNETGYYQIDDAPASITFDIISASKEGHPTDNVESVTIDDPGDTIEMNFTFPEASFIDGYVTDADGNAIEDVDVSAYPLTGGPSFDRQTTDEDGYYNLTVPEGESLIGIHDPGEYEDYWSIDGVSTTTGETTEHNIVLQGTGTIEGQIDVPDGVDLESAHVSAADSTFTRFSSTNIDEDGSFSLDVGPGTWELHIEIDGLPDEQIVGLEVEEDETVEVDLEFDEPAHITGTVETDTPQEVFVMAQSDDGDEYWTFLNDTGHYEIDVSPGEYRVIAFGMDEHAQPETIDELEAGEIATADFDMAEAQVTNQSVEVIDGSIDYEDRLNVSVGVMGGVLDVRVTDDNADLPEGTPHELEDLGVDESTTFEINFTVESYEPDSLLWAGQDLDWTVEEVGEDVYNVSIEVSPVEVHIVNQAPVGPLMGQDPSDVHWPSGNDDVADDGRNATVLLGLFDLSMMPPDVADALGGMTVGTNAQAFSMPSVADNTLEVWVGGPSRTVDGETHEGSYEAFIPDRQLDEWGVDDPENDLTTMYRGEETDFDANEVEDGVWIAIDNITYSAGTIAVSPSEPEFSILDTSLNTTEIEAGESVDIDATIENDGTADGTYEANLTVDDEVVESTTIDLDPGESDTVTFTRTFDDAGEFDIDVNDVTVDSLTVSSPDDDSPAQPDLSLVEASLAEDEIEEGETIEVDATIENDGDAQGTYTAELEVDGEVVGSTDIDVDAGESETVTITHTFDDTGEYEIAVDDEDIGTITVVEPPEADITLMTTSLDTTDIEPGETVQIEATLENLGEAMGTTTVAFTVDDETVDEHTVQLDAGNDTVVTVEHTFDEPGEYDVSVDDESAGTVTVTEPTPDIGLIEADLDVDEIEVGTAVEITATIENTGDAIGETTVTLFVDDDAVEEHTVEVEAGSDLDVEFEHVFEEPGEFEIAVDAADAGTITVVETTPTPTPAPTPTPTPVDTPTPDTPTPTDTPTTPEPLTPTPDTPDADDIPGFTIAVAMLAIIGAGLLLWRRQLD